MSDKADALVLCASGSIIMQALLGDFEGINSDRLVASAREWLADFERLKSQIAEATEKKTKRQEPRTS